MIRVAVCLTISLLLLAASTPAVRAADEPLPSDARIKTGTLPNGVRWMYRQHDNPPGKMAMIIHVDTGSLNETDEQRGLAHFIEHMAFNGSENFPPGTLIPYFESIGMEFGGDLNAFTSFDQTAYMLFLPDTSVEQSDKALMVLSDYAFRLSLLDEEIEKERGVILSELRAGMSAMQRVRDATFEKLFVGMRLGQRLPIGIESVIRAAQRTDFEDYYRAWYRPERVTLILVGDAAPDAYVPLIEKWFGQYRAAGAARSEKGPELKPFTGERGLVITDPEYSRGEVDVYAIRPGRPAVTTLAQARVALIDDIASWIMQRRFSERIKKGQASFREASVEAVDMMHDAIIAQASATGEPKNWEKMLEELIVEVNRAREFGFLPGEFELCKKELVSSAEDAVRKEPTRNARSMLFGIMSAVNQGEPVMSAQQELDVLLKLLPTIQLEEVSRAFAAHFEPGAFTYVVTLPKSDDVALPAEEQVLAAGRAAMARRPDPPTDVRLATGLLDHEPTPGKLTESTHDEGLGITSGWLANGARLHHRFMDYKKDLVLVTITLAGGQIEETAANVGVTQVAGLIVAQPATSRLNSTDIENLMTGKNVRVQGRGSDDAFTITVSGSPRDLESGLQLAYTLLTDGKLESSAFDNWKQRSLQQYAMVSRMPQFAAFDAFAKAASGDDPRQIVLMTPEIVEAQTIDRAQAWFERLGRTAPIEVAVVGEVRLVDVLPLIEKYVGSLPTRPRTATHLDPLRKLNRGPGPLERRVSVETITPQAAVVAGFMSAEPTNIRHTRALNLAANILDSRLIKQVRETLGLVYSIGARNVPEPSYIDSSFFLSNAPCAPDRGDAVIKEIEAIYAAFAQSGPTPEEFDNAKKQILNRLDTQLKEPSYWSEQLQALELHKRKLDDLRDIPQAYEALTRDEVQAVFAEYYVPQRVFRVLAVPTVTPAERPTPAEQPTPEPERTPG